MWLPFEIHPETPPEGVALEERFPGLDLPGMLEHLNALGSGVGVSFLPFTLLSNSRQALEAGELARDHGRFEALHDRLFEACFREGLDIGSRRVLLDAAETAGLDPAELEAALADGRYRPRLEETSRRAREKGIRAAPTFEIDRGSRIVGVVPIEKMRAALREARAHGT